MEGHAVKEESSELMSGPKFTYIRSYQRCVKFDDTRSSLSTDLRFLVRRNWYIIRSPGIRSLGQKRNHISWLSSLLSSSLVSAHPHLNPALNMDNIANIQEKLKDLLSELWQSLNEILETIPEEFQQSRKNRGYCEQLRSFLDNLGLIVGDADQGGTIDLGDFKSLAGELFLFPPELSGSYPLQYVLKASNTRLEADCAQAKTTYEKIIVTWEQATKVPMKKYEAPRSDSFLGDAAGDLLLDWETNSVRSKRLSYSSARGPSPNPSPTPSTMTTAQMPPPTSFQKKD